MAQAKLGMDLQVDKANADEIVLRLEDLLPDAAGEIVLFAEDSANVSVVVAAALTDTGIADAHITASGVDVTGLPYYAFDNGITIYFPDDVPLSFAPDVP